MPLPAYAFIINAVLLLLSLILAIIILRAGAKHLYNYGDGAVQERMKWIILRCMLGILFIGTVAAVLNLVLALL